MTLGPLAALADYVPAGFVAASDDLKEDGYVNGQMDPDRLMESHRCQLERDAAYMFALLMAAAEEDGIRLEGGDCYRSRWTQARAYERRCPWTEIEVRAFNPDTGEAEPTTKKVRECSGPPTARPGHSNHGWGRAVDFTKNGRVLSCRDDSFRWLQANAHRWGWVHPPWAQCGSSMEEAWHWEWAGVIDAQLVPDYSAIWLFQNVTLAYIRADVEDQVPLPYPSLDDSGFAAIYEDLAARGLVDRVIDLADQNPRFGSP